MGNAGHVQFKAASGGIDLVGKMAQRLALDLAANSGEAAQSDEVSQRAPQ